MWSWLIVGIDPSLFDDQRDDHPFWPTVPDDLRRKRNALVKILDALRAKGVDLEAVERRLKTAYWSALVVAHVRYARDLRLRWEARDTAVATAEVALRKLASMCGQEPYPGLPYFVEAEPLARAIEMCSAQLKQSTAQSPAKPWEELLGAARGRPGNEWAEAAEADLMTLGVRRVHARQLLRILNESVTGWRMHFGSLGPVRSLAATGTPLNVCRGCRTVARVRDRKCRSCGRPLPSFTSRRKRPTS
jgi:hypothetical protein